MSSQKKESNKESSGGLAFEVAVEANLISPRCKQPKHLHKRLGGTQERPSTPDAIVQRQRNAEQRRLSKEKERVQRIHDHNIKVEKVAAETSESKKQAGDANKQGTDNP